MKKLLILISFIALMGPTGAFANPIGLNSITAPVVSCSSTTSRVALSNPTAPQVEVYNAGSVPVFLVAGSTTVVAVFPTSAAITGKIIAPGMIGVYTLPVGIVDIACITASSTATVYLSTNSGN